MEDGWYLATYLNPAGVHRPLDVYFRHDNNISLWEKRGRYVTLLRHWEYERTTGQKMHRTPFVAHRDQVAFIDRLLAPTGLRLADMTAVWGTPDLAAGAHPWVEPDTDLAFHSIAHLYSAILLDSDVFFDGTVVGMAVDAGPDRLLDRRFKPHWYAGCVVRRGRVELHPVESPGPLYCEARDHFGLREGTLMALATATGATGRCDREAVLEKCRFDGFDGMAQAALAFREILAQVTGTADADPRFTERENLISAVMKEVQAISVAIMERNTERLLDVGGVDPAAAHLALAGGYALNCPTNSHLMDRYGFRGLLAPPCVGDSGQSIGIALEAFHRGSGGERFHFRFPGPYLGSEDGDLAGALARHARFVESVTDDFDPAAAVADLREGPVAWFAGRAESGPRALGNRSILADPTSSVAKDVLNQVKRREWWRPVAPVVLAEHADAWFEGVRPSPHMLETFAVRADRRARVPAVAHLDGTARVQTLTRAQNPLLHRLITAFHAATGVPMLCNTSLNDKGEPIVDTIEQAMNFCLRRGVRVAYFDGRRVAFRDFADYPERNPAERVRAPFTDVDPWEALRVRAEANPHGLPGTHLYLYLRDLELHDRHDIRTAEGAAAVRAAIDRRLRADPDLWVEVERDREETARQFENFGGAEVVNGRVPVYRVSESSR
ncbi:carbamoyltransferase C-terminal domain-containing protein [Saccharothrix australiensis]|uniref:Carbamoyltransferase-like protein n=1 Tax=Saccharothrix australiensis TaxID=2072 RepID=A0A495W1T2_9PSEU|nr:carbamoyltransferase C-terminal domain-containing protein [Saccharothrix australiensis]RKT54675.1 carbamoyltransferase-like protein [Saccharothrix australiensis]